METEVSGLGPMLVRRQLGRRLRGLREQAGKTHGDAEVAGLGHRSTLWRIEAGRSRANPATVRALCWLYGADEQTTEALYAMSRQCQQPGWWEEYGSHLPSWFTLYVGLEAEATVLSTCQQSLVHGLLQTEAYAHAVLSVPDPGAPPRSEEHVESLVRIRMERQRSAFDRPDPLRLHAVLGEAALRCEVGGPEVVRAQLDHLRTLNRKAYIDIRVLPFRAGADTALHGVFTVLELPDPADPDVVYIEALDGARYLETAADLERFRTIFASAHARSIPLEEFS